MVLTPGTDTYNTPEELDTYAIDNGIDLVMDKSQTLLEAMKHNESKNYSGSKTNPSQSLGFPRNGNGYVPGSIKKAQLVVACLIDSGGGVSGDVDGVWQENPSINNPEVDALLNPFILNEIGND